MIQHNGQNIPLSQASAILSGNINKHHTLWRKALERHAMARRRERDARDGTILRQLWTMIRRILRR